MSEKKQPLLDGAKHRGITKQAMFTLAVTGLRSQGFERCLSNGEPTYADGCGRHCAWGWVDPLGTDSPRASRWFVAGLMTDGIGIAATLDLNHIEFASQLQWCHDDSASPVQMERRLRQLASRENLTWPQ